MLTDQSRLDDEDCPTFDSLLEVSLPLPENLSYYPNQVGGHERILYSSELGTVYKRLEPFPKGPREVRFYERVFNLHCRDKKLLELRKFLPVYTGLCHDQSSHNLYVSMEDLLSGLEKPAVCDIKIGRTTHTPDATPAKLSAERAKYAWHKEIGFSVTAMKTYDSSTGEEIHRGKNQCRSLEPSEIYEKGICLFLGEDLDRSRCLARNFAKKLSRLCHWFETQRKIAFYASSVLLSYDEQLDFKEKDTERSSAETDFSRTGGVRVYLIDFTRWRPSNGEKDENFLYGLRNVVRMFRQASTDKQPLMAIKAE
ncbi:unnamed protein product [Calicophoron daubneyi]|uniref:Kinase n=1 Tax=Calicophoron daubneyi TaxID=300641 RepID=A0AAV2TAF8_CALDB